jgi:GcrA cell cycle regulator
MVAVDFWNAERIDRLVQAWDEGCTAVDIADELGTTKNAVIGRLDRMKLLAPRRPASAARQRYEAIASAFEERGDHGCSWPEGAVGDKNFRFCGEQRPYIDSPYCERHASAAYLPKKRGTKIEKSAPAPANANGAVEELENLVAA